MIVGAPLAAVRATAEQQEQFLGLWPGLKVRIEAFYRRLPEADRDEAVAEVLADAFLRFLRSPVDERPDVQSLLALPRRCSNRKIANLLVLGQSVKHIERRYRVDPARVFRIRRRLHRGWHQRPVLFGRS